MEKVQLARNLKDSTILDQGMRLHFKIDQEYCDSANRTQATIVWYTEDLGTTFHVAQIHAKKIKFHQK